MIANKLSLRDLEPKLKGKEVFLYGAGATGSWYLKVLKEHNVKIKAFIDDYNKVDSEIDGIPVKNPAILKKDNKEEMIVLLSNIYIKETLKRLEAMQLPNLSVFEMMDEYYADLVKDSWLKRLSHDALKQFSQKIEELKLFILEDKSRKILDEITKYLLSGNYHSTSIFKELYEGEPHYLIPEVLKCFRGKKINVVDGGAYYGELLTQMQEVGLNVGHHYCFEISQKNFKELEKVRDHTCGETEMICINKGLWDQPSVLYVENQEAWAKVSQTETGETVDLITLDQFFEDNEKIDFIKMDIEGAEMKALKGGEQMLINHRPVLAISIYHQLDDFVEIPLYLNEILRDYTFLIRHHSAMLSETVLYGIPNECRE